MNSLGIESLCRLTEVRFLKWLNLHKSYAKDEAQECFAKLTCRVPDLGAVPPINKGMYQQTMPMENTI